MKRLRALGISAVIIAAAVIGTIFQDDTSSEVVSSEVDATLRQMPGKRTTEAEHRDPASMRTVEMTALIDKAGSPAAFNKFAQALCKPLQGRAEEAPCLAGNDVEQGARYCVAGSHVGWVLRMPVTAAQLARFQGVNQITLAEPESLGWVPCPE